MPKPLLGATGRHERMYLLLFFFVGRNIRSGLVVQCVIHLDDFMVYYCPVTQDKL